MNKSITQATQNDKQISKSIKRFFLGSSFYTFLTKCLISHGYRLFKCCLFRLNTFIFLPSVTSVFHIKKHSGKYSLVSQASIHQHTVHPTCPSSGNAYSFQSDSYIRIFPIISDSQICLYRQLSSSTRMS